MPNIENILLKKEYTRTLYYRYKYIAIVRGESLEDSQNLMYNAKNYSKEKCMYQKEFVCSYARAS